MLSITLVNFVGRNLLSDRLLDQIAEVGRLFNAHSGRSAQMKLESAAVDAGEEVLAEPGNQNRQGAEAGRKESYQEKPPVMETESPAACDSSRESFRRPLQIAVEAGPADCG